MPSVFDNMAAYLRSKCEVDSYGCWLWKGQKDKDGYGIFRRHSKDIWHKAHRVSYAVHCGDIPARLGVLHRCDVRSCINPDHLYAGTQEDNVRDMHRSRYETAKRTAATAIRYKHGASINALCRENGVNPGLAYRFAKEMKSAVVAI